MKQLLWTIQHEEAYREFERSGILVANKEFLFCGDDLRFAYDWLFNQMRDRVGPPPQGNPLSHMGLVSMGRQAEAQGPAIVWLR